MRGPSIRLLSLVALSAFPAAAQQPVRVLEERLRHLGDSHITTWPEVSPHPEGTELTCSFDAAANRSEYVLQLRHRDVDNVWSVRINGVEIGQLERGKAMVQRYLLVPADTLVDGLNELTIRPDKTTDDIVLGDIRLHRQSLRSVLKLQPVVAQVRDGDGQPLPAKVTITTSDGQLAELYYSTGHQLAVRPGIAYTTDGLARFELPPGDYVLHATRGTEWGLDIAPIHVPETEPGAAPIGPITLTIDREVDTTGYVACDSHIHTYTHSGHGDATVEERLISLAGEGVELAIATDHNHHTDYRPLQAEMGLEEHFTSVTGNEVTTRVGHMNAFPLPPDGGVPNHELKDWVLLVDDIRAHGAKVVVLNHPRWPQVPTGPFGVFHLDRFSGELPGQTAVPFDAMELVNSTQLMTSPFYLLADWFALLNHGEKITAVGTSDSHTVGDPVGQGRTYVRSSTDVPAEIDIDEACDAFLAGDTTISLGIFCELTIDDRYHMGEIVPVRDGEVSISLRVAAPSWVRPRSAHVFLNGVKVAQEAVPAADGAPTDVRLPLVVDTPAHDAHLICMIVGDPIRGAYWPTQKGYTMAATNPVYLDVDGDGDYSSPRALAQRLVDSHGVTPTDLGPALSEVDRSVAVEAASIARAKYEDGAENVGALQAARDKLQQLVTAGGHGMLIDYLESLPTPEQVFEAKEDE